MRRRRVGMVLVVLGLFGLLALVAWLGPGSSPPPAAPVVTPTPRAPVVVRAQKANKARTFQAPEPPAEPEPVPEALEVPADETPLLAFVALDIVDEDGRTAERAFPQPVDCPGFAAVGRGLFAAEPGTCVLRAYRRDGALDVRGPVEVLDLAAGTLDDAAYAQLPIRSARTGGIGVQFRPHPDGMSVVRVIDGLPAAAAGLEPGDVITHVGGEPVAGWSPEEFVDLMTGAEGTDVEFEVQFETDTGVGAETVVARRAFVSG